jgi:hypothetical protein
VAFGLRLVIGIAGAVLLIWMGTQLGLWWQRREGQPQVVTVEVATVTGTATPTLSR